MTWKQWLTAVCGGVLLMTPLSIRADSGGNSGPFGTPSEQQAKPPQAQSDYETGYRHLKAGEYKKAIQAFDKVLKDNPFHALAYSNQGYSYRKLGQYEKALELYEKALALEPNLAEAHEYIGEAYLGLGKLAEAKKHLAILEQLDPKLANDLRVEIARTEKRS
ncbi:MAG: tetratricopeptide repeat protein [Candidatus Tectimicrobiota bacterium]